MSENSQKHKPRPHQTKAIEDTLNVLKYQDQSRASVVMACGTGKTLTQMWTAEALKPSRIVVFVPTLALLKQVRNVWNEQHNWTGELKSICVCSDKTVTNPKGNNNTAEQDDEDELTLADLGMTSDINTANSSELIFATTDADEINRQIDLMKGTPESPVVIFSTYKSIDVLAEALNDREIGDRSVDTSILDEAQKTAGDANSHSAKALHNNIFYSKKRIAYTATPKVITRRKKDKEGEDEIASMDNVELYGPRAYTLTTAQAIHDKLIVDYQLAISVVNDNEDEDQINRESLRHLQVDKDGKLLDAKLVADQLVVSRTMKDFNLEKGVLFFNTIEAAERHSNFANENEDILGTGHIQNFSISGRQSMRVRDEAMGKFESADFGVVGNSRCFIEGLDSPSIDLIAFMDPKKSPFDIAQAVGRAMRNATKKSGDPKTKCVILLPLHIQKGETLEQVLASEGYQKISDVLAALATNDDRLKGMFQTALTLRGQRNAEEKNKILDTDETDKPLEIIQQSLSEQTGGLMALQGDVDADQSKIVFAPGMAQYFGQIEFQKLTDAIGTKLMDDVGDGWFEKLGILKEWMNSHDNQMPNKRSKDPLESTLGYWLANQKIKFNKDELNNLRIMALDKNVPGWDNGFHEKWQENLNNLLDWMKTHNNQIPKIKSKDPLEKNLRTWLNTQKTKFYKGELNQFRIRKLDNNIPEWNKGFNEQWQENFDKVMAWMSSHNNQLPSIYSKDSLEKKLGNWLGTQKDQFNKNELDSLRIEALDKNVPRWNIGNYELWQENLDKVIVWMASHNNQLPYGKSKNPLERTLGDWLNKQKYSFNNEKLDILKIDLLNKNIPGWDKGINEQWQDNLNKYIAWINSNNQLPYGQSKDPLEKKLGLWLGTQKTLFNKNELDPLRIEALNKNLPGWNKKKQSSTETTTDSCQHTFKEDTLQITSIEYTETVVIEQKLKPIETISEIHQEQKPYPIIVEPVNTISTVKPLINPVSKIENIVSQLKSAIPSVNPNILDKSVNQNKIHDTSIPNIAKLKSPSNVKSTIDALSKSEKFKSSTTSINELLKAGEKQDDERDQAEFEKSGKQFSVNRPEQSEFRRKMWFACGGQCVFSGDDTPSALEAAHRGGAGDWLIQNQYGYLLRADLHRSMDGKFLNIIDNKIQLDPKGFTENGSKWNEFHGKEVHLVDLNNPSTWPIFINPKLKEKFKDEQSIYAQYLEENPKSVSFALINELIMNHGITFDQLEAGYRKSKEFRTNDSFVNKKAIEEVLKIIKQEKIEYDKVIPLTVSNKSMMSKNKVIETPVIQINQPAIDAKNLLVGAMRQMKNANKIQSCQEDESEEMPRMRA